MRKTVPFATSSPQRMFLIFCVQFRKCGKIMNRLIENFFVVFIAWAGLGFLRGGGEIFKNFSEISSTFFMSIKLIFRALPEHKKILFGQNLCAAGKFFKKRANNSNFLGKFDQKIAFFSLRVFRLKTNTIGAEGALEKF